MVTSLVGRCGLTLGLLCAVAPAWAMELEDGWWATPLAIGATLPYASQEKQIPLTALNDPVELPPCNGGWVVYPVSLHGSRGILARCESARRTSSRGEELSAYEPESSVYASIECDGTWVFSRLNGNINVNCKRTK